MRDDEPRGVLSSSKEMEHKGDSKRENSGTRLTPDSSICSQLSRTSSMVRVRRDASFRGDPELAYCNVRTMACGENWGRSGKRYARRRRSVRLRRAVRGQNGQKSESGTVSGVGAAQLPCALRHDPSGIGGSLESSTCIFRRVSPPFRNEVTGRKVEIRRVQRAGKPVGRRFVTLRDTTTTTRDRGRDQPR
ncbi:hypothetical protein DBV15_08402 [Temnothorax longispinosus]|uniref:Uncharacterized protein n=1 Tax=Temnothorax longispinosus TaxID=300112 RepID=A0A4S2K0U6_9HYME|nr:hypothetical protein DBV15_08402 [Temnothorax longispinosus]